MQPPQPNITELIEAWQDYLSWRGDWREITEEVDPKETPNGFIYELRNVLERPNEDFAIADMQGWPHTEPHYHPDKDIEVYFVLEGSGLVVVGDEEKHVVVGDVLVIPPKTVHYTVPDEDLVIAVINTPPFDPERYIAVTETNPKVGFDKDKFEKLITSK
jgi:mannose-6-phosphate isomerase-like protein (cupin superfamily)